MLKLIQENKKLISLLHDDCTFDKTKVQSIMLDFLIPVNKKVILNELSIPTAQHFIDNALTTLLNITPNMLGLKEFNDGVYKLDYWILIESNYSITYDIDTNIVNGVGILNDFLNTNYIYLDAFYEIDKTKCTINQLFLKRKIKTVVSTYSPTYKFSEYFAKTYNLNQFIISEIEKITPCNDCNSQSDNICDKMIMLISIKNNIDCKNVEGAEKIFNYLSSLYPNFISC